MIYQLRTCNDLYSYKGLFENKNDLKKQVKKILEVTEVFRKSLSSEIMKAFNWKENISKDDFARSVDVLEIDPILCPEYNKLFGAVKEITDVDLKEMVAKKIESMNKKNEDD